MVHALRGEHFASFPDILLIIFLGRASAPNKHSGHIRSEVLHCCLEGWSRAANMEVRASDTKTSLMLIPLSRQPFWMGHSTEPQWLLVEGSTLVVALCLRRQAFRDHSTLESLLAGREVIIEFKPELLDKPFLCRSTGGGWKVDHDHPMRDAALRRKFSVTAEKAGMGGKFPSVFCAGVT